MLRQIAILLLVPILIIPGIKSDEFCSILSFSPAGISTDNSYDPDRCVADFARTLIVQIILVISFLQSSFYFIPRQGPPVRFLRGRAPPLSRRPF